jgi:Flp pilus assembly protein TadG
MNLIKRFRSDNRGVSAVEFALIAPVMLSLYLGSFEVSQAIAIDRLVKLTSSTVTNLVSQYTSISATSDMPDILQASAQVLAPNSNANAAVVVTCLSIDGTGRATVSWSQALNGSPRTTGQVVTLPAAMDIPNTQLVMGETALPYTSPIQFLPLGVWNLYAVTYMFPRSSPTITLTS